MKNQFFLQVFVKFFTKKKVIFFALRVKVKKFKKMKKMPLFAFPHKAWGGVTMRHLVCFCRKIWRWGCALGSGVVPWEVGYFCLHVLGRKCGGTRVVAQGNSTMVEFIGALRTYMCATENVLASKASSREKFCKRREQIRKSWRKILES